MAEEKVRGGRKPRKELRNKATRKRRKIKKLLKEIDLSNTDVDEVYSDAGD